MTAIVLAESVGLPSLAATGEVWLMAQEEPLQPRFDRPLHPAMAMLIRHPARTAPNCPAPVLRRAP